MPTGSIIWDLDDDTVYPVPAYDVPRRQRP